MTPIHSKPLFETRTKGGTPVKVFEIVPDSSRPYRGLYKEDGAKWYYDTWVVGYFKKDENSSCIS